MNSSTMQELGHALSAAGPWDDGDDGPETPLVMESSPPPPPPPVKEIPPPEPDAITLLMSKINNYINEKNLKIGRIFAELDSSGNGMLDEKEFKLGLRKIVEKADFILSNDDCLGIFYRCDKDRSGELNYKEFDREIRNADLERQAALKARRDAAGKNNDGSKKGKKGKKKKGKPKPIKDWRTNRKRLRKGAPTIMRWIVDDSFTNDILRHEKQVEEDKRREQRNARSSSMFRRKKAPTILSKAVSSLPPLPSQLLIGDSFLTEAGGNEKYHTPQIMIKYGSKHPVLGGPIKVCVPSMTLGRGSLPLLRSAAQNHGDNDDATSAAEDLYFSDFSDFSDFSEDSVDFSASKEDKEETTKQKSTLTTTHSATTFKEFDELRKKQQQVELGTLGTIHIEHGSLRSGAFAGALGSYHHLLSTQSLSSTQDSGVTTVEPHAESLVKVMHLANNHINATSLRTMLAAYPSLSHGKKELCSLILFIILLTFLKKKKKTIFDLNF